MIREWLARFLAYISTVNVKHRNASKAEPLTANVLATGVSVLLERQRADAADMDANSAHWGFTGGIVRRAVTECERVLLPLPNDSMLEDYFKRVVPELAELANRYRNDQNDPEGYGLGTVREVEEAVKAMMSHLDP